MPINNVLQVNFPKESGRYRVVQLDIDNHPYLRFEDDKWFVHWGILKGILDKTNRKYPTIIKKDTSFDDNVPALKSDWYKVYGIGSAEVDTNKKIVSLFGYSGTYNIGIDQRHLDTIRPLAPDWTFGIKE